MAKKSNRPRAQVKPAKRRRGRARRHFTLALFGVVNSGKTSLARSLMMRPDFGEVGITPGSTRTVAQVHKDLAKSKSRFTVVDTPGIEGFFAVVSAFAAAAVDLEERNWIERFDAWLSGCIAELGPRDRARPTVEHRFKDAYDALQKADVLCLVNKGSDLLQENVREDVAALMSIVRRLKKPIFSTLKDAGSDAFAKRRRDWEEFSRSLGINQIAYFDSHRRRRSHSRHFFRALESTVPVSRRGDIDFVRRAARAMQLPSPMEASDQLRDLTATVWQGRDWYNPFSRRHDAANEYSDLVRNQIVAYVREISRRSMWPKHGKQEVEAMSREIADGSATETEIVEHSSVGVFDTAFYVRLKSRPAARLIATLAFMRIEAALWGGGQGHDRSAWQAASFQDRLHAFVASHGKAWAHRLSSIREEAKSAGFDPEPYDDLAEEVIGLVESLT